MDPIFLVEECYKQLPPEMKSMPWKVTNHGRKELTTKDELNAYIAAYGEMHIVKCRAALQNFPFENLERYTYEIFDWGCGQGLATLTLLEMLRDRGLLSRLKKIWLIEPSECAIKRAESWVKQCIDFDIDIDVVSINKYIPKDDNARMDEISCSSRISINLFSNILDIRSLSLLWLANKTSSLALTNYMVCIGPKFHTQDTRTRISDFCGYFNPTEYFSNINSFPYSHTTRTHYPYGCETKCFVHEKGSMLDKNYYECATDTISYDPYDYSTEVMSGVVADDLLHFYIRLRESSGTSYDVFFRPAINCDTVDFVLTSKSKGIIIINVCDDLSEIDNAVNKLKTIKENIFNIHLRSIKIDSVGNRSVFNCVKCALFFPGKTDLEIETEFKKLNDIKNSEGKENSQCDKDHFAYLYKFTSTTDLKKSLDGISANFFKNDYYEEIVNIIASKWHTYKEGDRNFRLSNHQKELVRSDNKRLRITGVAGCGKTQVVANRAVEQHLKTGEKVLILTYNISLIQYIRMRICQIPADFSPSMFEVINYHQFFKSKANLYASNRYISLSDFDSRDFFSPYKEQIKKYKTIIIDEVQNFKESWIQSVITYFLSDDGSVSLFGDGEQNIYGRKFDAATQMPPIRDCGFTGSWNKMNERISMRIMNPKIASLSSMFAQSFLGRNESLNIQEEFMFDNYLIQYEKADNTTPDILANKINKFISENNINTGDVAVLGLSIKLLRDVEAAYVRLTNEKTMINFETAQQFEDINNSSKYARKEIEDIRHAAKTHFTTACEHLKFSTIHSFQGWESKTVILLLEGNYLPEQMSGTDYDKKTLNLPALINLALTRARCNLFILNIDNCIYHSFFTDNLC